MDLPAKCMRKICKVELLQCLNQTFKEAELGNKTLPVDQKIVIEGLESREP